MLQSNDLLQEPYDNLTVYGKVIVDTLRKINSTFSINLERNETNKINEDAQPGQI